MCLVRPGDQLSSRFVPPSSCNLVKVTGPITLQNARYLNLKLSAYAIETEGSVTEHAVVHAPPANENEPPWVRINSACYTGDIFGDRRCDCHEQMLQAFDIIGSEGGLLIYHFGHEGRGLGFIQKIEAAALMEAHGLSTFAASNRVANISDARTYDADVVILRKGFGFNRVRLLTNNPLKIAALSAGGIDVVSTRRLISRRREVQPLLEAKRREQNHMIDFDSNQGG